MFHRRVRIWGVDSAKVCRLWQIHICHNRTWCLDVYWKITHVTYLALKTIIHTYKSISCHIIHRVDTRINENALKSDVMGTGTLTPSPRLTSTCTFGTCWCDLVRSKGWWWHNRTPRSYTFPFRQWDVWRSCVPEARVARNKSQQIKNLKTLVFFTSFRVCKNYV